MYYRSRYEDGGQGLGEWWRMVVVHVMKLKVAEFAAHFLECLGHTVAVYLFCTCEVIDT